MIYITKNLLSNWSGILESSYDTYANKLSAALEHLNIPLISVFKAETLQFILQNLWFELQNGFGLADLDRVIIFIIIFRLSILAIRYNIVTSITITLAGLFAGYLWYSRFIKLIALYETGLYKISYTNQLAADATQIQFLIDGTIKNSDYKIKVDNPIGIILYAFGNASTYNGHRIDPLSMIVAKLPENSLFKSNIENIYYLIYRKLIPTIFRIAKIFHRQLHTIVTYTVITRVNKRYCPYIIRWHWTLYFLIAGTDRILVSLFRRTEYYWSYHLVPYLEDINNLTVNSNNLKNVEFETQVVNYLSFYIIMFSLSLTLFLLFHALCGQYVYLPFFTENVELHVGARNKESIYSGGLTAWQDPLEKEKYKVWFGWFGRGTLNKQDIAVKLRKFLYRCFYNIYSKLRKINR